MRYWAAIFFALSQLPAFSRKIPWWSIEINQICSTIHRIPELNTLTMKPWNLAFFAGLLIALFWGPNYSLAQEKGHVIKKGETLSAIARQYKTTVAELIRLNPEAKKGISAGATLRLPSETPELEKSEPPATSNPGFYTVRSGDSFSKIARKFKVSVADLEKWNGFSNSGLKAGAEIRVAAPVEDLPRVPDPVAVVPAVPTPDAGETLHTVSSGETLSKIARQYKISIGDLKSRNGLKSNQVQLGQVLKVPAKDKPVVRTPEPEKSAPVQANLVKVTAGTTTVSGDPAADPKKEATPVQDPAPVASPARPIEEAPANLSSGSIREVNNTLGYTRVVETGFAEAIEGEVNSRKHLCLHKSAPIGSILQVKNEVNGQTVYVKVIGKLPETGSNEKLIIRISRQAYEKLLASGRRFPVQVSYPEAQ